MFPADKATHRIVMKHREAMTDPWSELDLDHGYGETVSFRYVRLGFDEVTIAISGSREAVAVADYLISKLDEA